jgi:hypothetical protein
MMRALKKFYMKMLKEAIASALLFLAGYILRD